MKDKIKWLREQLSGWVDSGLLGADKARLIGEVYQDCAYVEPTALQARPLAPLAIVATLMLGLAAVMLFGSLDFRPDHLISGSIISGLLLVLPTAVMAWILYSKRVPASLHFLREPCILMQGICSGIAVFVFHSITHGFQGGDLFVFETGIVSYSWVPMMLVVMLVTRSHTLPFLLAIALLDLILVYIWNSNLPGSPSGMPEGFFSIITAMTWVYVTVFSILVLLQIKSLGRSRPRLSVLYMWAGLLVFAAALVFPLASVDKNITLILSAFFYASLIGVGRRFFYQHAESFEFQYRYRPFEMLGLMGIFSLAVYFGLLGLGLQDMSEVGNIGLTSYLAILPTNIYAILALLASAWLATLVIQFRYRDFSALPVTLFPLVPLVANTLIALGASIGTIQWLFLVYLVLGLALWMVITGIATYQRLPLVAGLVVLMAVILKALTRDMANAGELTGYITLLTAAAAALGLYSIKQRRMLLDPEADGGAGGQAAAGTVIRQENADTIGSADIAVANNSVSANPAEEHSTAGAPDLAGADRVADNTDINNKTGLANPTQQNPAIDNSLTDKASASNDANVANEVIASNEANEADTSKQREAAGPSHSLDAAGGDNTPGQRHE